MSGKTRTRTFDSKSDRLLLGRESGRADASTSMEFSPTATVGSRPAVAMPGGSASYLLTIVDALTSPRRGRASVAEVEQARAVLRGESEKGDSPQIGQSPTASRNARKARGVARVPFVVPKNPWVVPIKTRDEPAPPGKPGAVKLIAEQSGFLLPLQLEARIENGIWTLVDTVEGGIDLAVGRDVVWVLKKGGGRYQVNSETARYLSAELGSYGTKISASHGATDAEVAWVTDSCGLQFGSSSKNWKSILLNQALVDVAAGDVDPDDTGMLDVFVVTASGSVAALVAKQGKYDLANLKWFNSYPFGVRAVRVALARRRGIFLYLDGAGLSDLWVIRDDDEVANFAGLKAPLGPEQGGAWDIGAGGNAVWAVGTFESPDPGAHGNVLWRMDLEAKRWDRITPGWGVAVDADADGSAWVLDTDGKLWVRGLRTLSIGETWQAVPKPPVTPQAWDQLFTNIPNLGREATARTRALGAGGRTHLYSWDDLPLLTPQAVGPHVSSDPGFDVLFSFSTIFTSRHRVPVSVLAALGASKQVPKNGGGTFTLIDFTKLETAYLDALNKLAIIPGFRERVRYLSIGNEVDVYFRKVVFPQVSPSDAASALTSFVTFCTKVMPQIKKVLPDARVGVCWTHDGIFHPDPFWADAWQSMNAQSDILIATYYPTGNYQAEFPTKLLSLTSKPIVMQEVGMPTGFPTNVAKYAQLTQKQASFLEYVFTQWQMAGGRIRFLSWWPLFDYFYDSNVQVALTDPNDPTSQFVVTAASPGVPKTYTYQESDTGIPFLGIGNLLPYFFFGDRPGKPAGEPPANINNKDLVYWVAESTTSQKAFCEFFSTCALLQADGTPKLAASVFQKWAEKLRGQSV